MSDISGIYIIKNNLKGPRVGHLVSERTREKLRNCNLGKKASIETRRKIKIALSKIEIKRKPAFKKVFSPELNMEFNSVKEAAEYIGVHPSSVSAVLKKRQKTTRNIKFFYSKEYKREGGNNNAV